MWLCLRHPVFSRFGTVPVCGGQTNGRTHDDSIYRASLASCGENIRLLEIRPWLPGLLCSRQDKCATLDTSSLLEIV